MIPVRCCRDERSFWILVYYLQRLACYLSLIVPLPSTKPLPMSDAPLSMIASDHDHMQQKSTQRLWVLPMPRLPENCSKNVSECLFQRMN